LEGFEEDDHGTMGGASDNLVIALGLAMIGYKKFEHYRISYLAPPPPPIKKVIPNYMTYTLDDVLSNLNERRGSDRMRNHIGLGYPYN
jgi:hypothetical protein